MGFFGRMMGTDPESRIRKAKKFLDRHDFGEARFELLELDHPEAKVLLRKALDGLVELNFEEAAARSRRKRELLLRCSPDAPVSPSLGASWEEEPHAPLLLLLRGYLCPQPVGELESARGLDHLTGQVRRCVFPLPQVKRE